MKELLLSGDTESAQYSAALWDPVTGTQVSGFRGAAAAARTLTWLPGLVLAAERGRPQLQLWRLGQPGRRDTAQQRLFTPGPVSALTADPGGTWLALASAELLQLYHLASGQLAAQLTRHFQPVTCLRFSSDGAHLLSAGQDGLVLVWSTADCVDPQSPDTGRPLHVLSHHALPVTDLQVGGGGPRARLCTCSLDQTCKVYQLASGRLLLSVAFDQALRSVAWDLAERRVYVGAAAGAVYSFPLTDPPRSLELHVPESSALTLTGHTAAVTCLAVSSDGLSLASGSEDGTVRVWHLPSGQCLRTHQHRGVVTNLLYIPAPGQPSSGLQLPAQLGRQPPQPGQPLQLQLPIISRPADTDTDTDAEPEPTDQLRRQLHDSQNISNSLYQFLVEKVLNGHV